MTLQLIQDGNRPSGTEWMNNWNEVLNISGKNLIRTLIDRSTTFSETTDDWFTEAYVDSNGRLNSVDTTASVTTAYFNSDKYRFIPFSAAGSTESATATGYTANYVTRTTVVTTSTTGIFTGVNVTVQNGAYVSVVIKDAAETVTYASKNSSVNQDGILAFTPTDYAAGPLAAATYHIILTVSTSNQLFAKDAYTYAGTNFSLTNTSVSGPTSGTRSPLQFTTYSVATYSDIIHNIPASKFTSSISKSYLTPLFASLNTNESLTYKLTNTSEDSGWLNYGVINSFTAFTSEPTKLTVRLTASSIGTSTPSIYGVALRCT